MKPLFSIAIRYADQKLHVLNQQNLPQIEEWLEVTTPKEMESIITSLKVRGAPLIGIAAILTLAQLVEKGASQQDIYNAALLLRESRPTAVNLSIYINQLIPLIFTDNYAEAILNLVEKLFNEDIALCDLIGKNGAALIASKEHILTCCNTGGLATAGIGTALGVIHTAHLQGKDIHVFACETRPLLQGGRLTAWELNSHQIPYTLICDNMAAHVMSQGKVSRVLVGADRIAINGDFANKIGTYSLAVLAHYHQIPFHVVAPYTTCDRTCADGQSIIIEQRAEQEIRGACGAFGKVTWSPIDAPTYNPSFDVTPASLVTSYILDKGNLSLEELTFWLKSK